METEEKTHFPKEHKFKGERSAKGVGWSYDNQNYELLLNPKGNCKFTYNTFEVDCWGSDSSSTNTQGSHAFVGSYEITDSETKETSKEKANLLRVKLTLNKENSNESEQYINAYGPSPPIKNSENKAEESFEMKIKIYIDTGEIYFYDDKFIKKSMLSSKEKWRFSMEKT